MTKKSLKGLRVFQLNLPGYGGGAYYADRIIALEKALARKPRQFQIDLLGNGEMGADWALLIRSILLRRSPRTRVITNARSSLQGGSVLVWLLGDQRIIRNDARIFFRRVDMTESNDADVNWVWKESDLKYVDSYSETDPEDSDYIKMLHLINEFLPVKELSGKVVNVPVLRQFGLVENEKLDRFLAAVFRQPKESAEHSSSEPKPKRTRASAKASQTK